MKLSKEVKIGMFALGVLLLTYWGVNFLKGTDLFRRMNTYYATYDQVSGLQPSSAIVINGYKVGVIKSMSFDPAKSSKVVLELNIKSKFQIPVNSTARVFSEGLMGGKSVEIDLGNATTYLVDGDTLKSIADKDFLEVAGSEFDFLKQRASQVVDEVMVTLGNMNVILEGNAQSLNVTMSNMASISGSLKDIISTESNDIRAIIENMNHLSKTLKNNSERIDNIIANVDGVTDSLSNSNIPTMVNNLSATLSQLNITLERVNSGQGTVGKFLNDDGLYDSLNVASGNLSRLLVDLREHPSRYVHISLFGRKDKPEKVSKK